MIDLTNQIAQCSEEIETWRAKRANLPLPHEKEFDLDEDERHLANIEAL